jgi:ABC-type transport system involved in cytochrome bd biosynthesis fused ATPase/permease subunit
MKRVTSDKKRERIKQRVIQGGIKAARRHKIDRSDTEELRRIQVQVMSPVVRLILGVIGVTFCVLPFTGLLSMWWMFLFIPIGLILICVAIYGRKREAEKAIEEIGGEFVGDLLTEVIGEIFSGL